MTFSLDVPSVHAIRTALESISGAVRDEPLPERVRQGTDPASEIGRFDPARLADSVSEGSLEYHELEGDDSDVFDQPNVVFEVPPRNNRCRAQKCAR
jgi:hypothetical protein